MDDVLGKVSLSMIHYFGNDVRRINHALKVHGFAKIIAGAEGLRDEALLILEIAALLHDIGIKESEKRFQSTSGHYQELLGPDTARDLMKDLKMPDLIASRIGYLIGHHHTYGAIDGLDFQILVEADFLVNIFEDQMEGSPVAAIHEKYFKTKTGTELLARMYMT